MIWIFHRERADAGSCENYDDLFQYINSKLLESPSGHEQISWSFSFFSPREVSLIYENTQQPLLTAVVKEAYEKEVGLIAICRGDFEQGDLESRIEILDTPDIDREALKKQWCLDYCDAHGYIVVENFSHHSTTQTQQQPQGLSDAAQGSNYLPFNQQLLFISQNSD